MYTVWVFKNSTRNFIIREFCYEIYIHVKDESIQFRGIHYYYYHYVGFSGQYYLTMVTF